MRIGRVLLLVALGGVGCATPATAPTSTSGAPAASARASAGLRRLLAAEEAAPTATELRAAGAEAGALIALARDEAVQPLVRTRAIAALKHFDDPPAKQFLQEMAARGATSYARSLAARSLVP